MKKLAIAFLLFSVCSVVRDAGACSIVTPDPQPIQARMLDAIAQHLGVARTAISPSAVETPVLLFPYGFEADCTGVESAVHAAIYSVHVTEGERTCTSWGMVVAEGVGGNGRITIYPQLLGCVA